MVCGVILGLAVPQGAGVGPRRILFRLQRADDGQAAFLVHTLLFLNHGIVLRQPGVLPVPVHVSVMTDPREAARWNLGRPDLIHTLDTLWKTRQRGRCSECFGICLGTS